MSTPQTADDELAKFIEEIEETYSAYEKSRQALDGEIPPEQRKGNDARRHNDGEAMYNKFDMAPIFRHLERAARRDHSVAGHPQALAHLILHLEKWEKWELKQSDPDLSDASRLRRGVLEWLADGDERMRRMRTGGTDLLIHGEQGTTKTTFMHWLVTAVMQLTPWENVIWLSTLDDVEWSTLGQFATVCVPAGVDVKMTVDPYRRITGGQQTELPIGTLSRDTLRYTDPADLFDQIAERTAGQFYVVYPDPRFRQCETITGWNYQSVYDVDDAKEATDLSHWWFALYEELVHGSGYNEWTTCIGDELQKWLHQKASSDDHDWWEKVQMWADTHGDARKKRVSFFGACHLWKEIHGAAKAKFRWGATMNGEDFPSEAPLDGSNIDQTLGETALWSSQKWNKIGYPDMKRHVSVPADFDVTYPGWEVEIDAKSK